MYLNQAETDFVNKLISKLNINPFSYSPKILAEIINKKFNNKRIVLYGNGKHSKTIIKNLIHPENIVKIIDDNVGMSVEEFKNSNIKYDFIVPSNHQYAYAMEEKLKKNNLKVLNLYSLDFFDFFPKKEIKIDKNKKPVLVVISPNYQPEQISLNAEYLSKKFDIYKIYLSDNKNIMFDNKYVKEFYIGNSIINLIYFLKQNNNIIDKTVLRTSPLRYYIFEIVRYFFKKELTVSALDWLIETQKYVVKNHKYYLEIENKILKEADKIIHSNGGDLFEKKILSKTQKPTLQYFHYLPKKFFSLKENNLNKNIDLCFIGHIPIQKNLENFIYGLTLEDYNNLSKNRIKTHLYMTIDRLDIFDILKNKTYSNIVFHNPKPLKNLLEEIKNYHFGLLLYPNDKETDELFGLHHSTVLVTKIFTYLFAGLPIIVTDEQKFLADFIKKYNVGIVIPRDEIFNINEIIKKHNYQQMKENIQKNIEKWSVEYNYKSLLRFLEK